MLDFLIIHEQTPNPLETSSSTFRLVFQKKV